MQNKHEILIPGWQCLRCNHQWPKGKIVPTVCPLCHSAYWSTPRQEKKKKDDNVSRET